MQCAMQRVLTRAFLREYLKNALDIFKNKQYFVGKILQKYYITALYKNLHRCP